MKPKCYCGCEAEKHHIAGSNPEDGDYTDGCASCPCSGYSPTPDKKTFSLEIKGEWFGIAIPEWLRAFDCRSSDKESFPKTSWGRSLVATERAQVDLGLQTEHCNNAATLVGCHTYTDARRANEAELRRQITNMIEEAEKCRLAYIKAQNNPSNDGGGCYYMPVGIALCNYGWTVIGDEKTCVVSKG